MQSPREPPVIDQNGASSVAPTGSKADLARSATAGSPQKFGHDTVLLEVADGIAGVWLNRPEALNACNMDMLHGIIDVFDVINDDSDIRVVVLRGRGRAFCVGADIKERQTMDFDAIRRRRRIAPLAFGAMRNSNKPVIASVHGYALGGGLELAINCDITLAAAGTSMGLIETLRGSIPAGGGTQLLPRLVGVNRAKELIFTGRTFLAEQAADWGLINHCYPVEELDEKVQGLAEEIRAAAPISVTQAKQAIDMSLDLDLANGIRAEAALYERTMTSMDRALGMGSVQRGSRPSFEGS